MKASGTTAPKIAKFRSAEVSAPYILACNHVDANPKLVLRSMLLILLYITQIKLSLNGLQMLLNYEVVPPTEAQNILRVLSIQVDEYAFYCFYLYRLFRLVVAMAKFN